MLVTENVFCLTINLDNKNGVKNTWVGKNVIKTLFDQQILGQNFLIKKIWVRKFFA